MLMISMLCQRLIWYKYFKREVREISLQSLSPFASPNPSAATNSDFSRGGRRFLISGHRGWWARRSSRFTSKLNTGEVRRIGGPLDALDLPVVAVCARIWVRSEIRDPPEPLKGRYHHAPASSSRSSLSSLSVRPKSKRRHPWRSSDDRLGYPSNYWSPVFKEFSTPSVLHFPYAKAPTVRLSVPVVCDPRVYIPSSVEIARVWFLPTSSSSGAPGREPAASVDACLEPLRLSKKVLVRDL
ncbi:hypothetical protein F2Q70_00001719 [Brassica cretica]|uniref:Uncharacterized protein n=1 Tax=Brassica cretica TaxID=69181 RepID=A0A8S9IU09_BRACR|nr:hypothetical protein F2Q70_00001719 [Brassica cretica]